MAVHKPERNGLLGAGVKMPGKMTDGWRGSSRRGEGGGEEKDVFGGV